MLQTKGFVALLLCKMILQCYFCDFLIRASSRVKFSSYKRHWGLDLRQLRGCGWWRCCLSKVIAKQWVSDHKVYQKQIGRHLGFWGCLGHSFMFSCCTRGNKTLQLKKNSDHRYCCVEFSLTEQRNNDEVSDVENWNRLMCNLFVSLAGQYCRTDTTMQLLLLQNFSRFKHWFNKIIQKQSQQSLNFVYTLEGQQNRKQLHWSCILWWNQWSKPPNCVTFLPYCRWGKTLCLCWCLPIKQPDIHVCSSNNALVKQSLSLHI